MCSVRIYAYGIVSSVRWVFLGTRLSDPGLAFGRGQYAETSAKKTNLERETILYAFSSTTLIQLSVHRLFICSFLSKQMSEFDEGLVLFSLVPKKQDKLILELFSQWRYMTLYC